ncbi:MAG: hypothetical protein ACYC61_26265 [Isosphaeraceae bacterium]
MMRFRTMFAGLTILTATCGTFTGCSSEPAGTDVPVGKPLSAEQQKEEQKKVMEGMKGMYQGAPGVPLKKE